jgi:hypothetical protein
MAMRLVSTCPKQHGMQPSRSKKAKVFTMGDFAQPARTEREVFLFIIIFTLVSFAVRRGIAEHFPG